MRLLASSTLPMTFKTFYLLRLIEVILIFFKYLVHSRKNCCFLITLYISKVYSFGDKLNPMHLLILCKTHSIFLKIPGETGLLVGQIGQDPDFCEGFKLQLTLAKLSTLTQIDLAFLPFCINILTRLDFNKHVFALLVLY